VRPAGDLLDDLGGRTCWPSPARADTRAQLRATRRVARAVRVNVEADSLNAAVLGADVDRRRDLDPVRRRRRRAT
jgi:hypothetical protein